MPIGPLLVKDEIMPSVYDGPKSWNCILTEIVFYKTYGAVGNIYFTLFGTSPLKLFR